VPKEPSGDLRVERLASAHDRAHFSCGVESLDSYFRTQAGQDIRRKANAVFVLVGAAQPKDILGYFTLCATALSQGDVREPARKLVPKYPLVSAALIGRLAVAKHSQRRGLGSILLAQALRKAYESASTVGSSMVVVDALDESACGFYAAHSFVRLPDSMRLVLSIGSIEKLLGAPGAP
jgi:GNAT superfamily N-acetyltransferase